MQKQSIVHYKLPVYILAWLCFSLFMMSGCFLKDVKRQTAIVDSTGNISGYVTVANGASHQVMVMLLEHQAGEQAFIRRNQLRPSSDGGYSFDVPPGKYYILAYVDLNNDAEYQPDEYASYHDGHSVIVVKPNHKIKLALISIDARLAAGIEPDEIKDNTYLAIKNIGRVVSLNDSMFSDINEKTGFWMPVRFLRQVGGGLLQLQPYQPRKIPVIFIHGVNGGANDFRRMIAGLDLKHYQPWVLYYPTGLRLDMVSDYLVRAVYDLQLKYRFKRLFIVAHSMGGLVARSFVMKYREHHPHSAGSIRLLMTINSPMEGFKRAEMGVRHSPVVVPSWRDVATDSQFIQKLQSWPWPHEIPYYLIFSYQNVGYGDGVVSLESQLPVKLQGEASKIYGFNDSHAGILSDPVFITRFRQILQDSRRQVDTINKLR